MAVSRRYSISPFRVSIGAMGFMIFIAMSTPLVAQTALKPIGDLSADAGIAPLPDAPTPANELPLPTSAFFGPDQERQAGQSPPPTQPPQNPQQPPSSSTPSQNPQQRLPSSAPSLGDLGLSAEETKPDLDAQARLDRRTHMLKVHQELGLYTLIPIAGACISSAWATPQRNAYGDTTARDVHVAIAGVAIGMYGATAYYAIRAPRVPDGPTRGGIKIHKYLIWIHAPGMILTPILGTMAFNDIANGQKVTGIAQYHSAVAWTTIAAYGASIIAVTWPIHLKL